MAAFNKVTDFVEQVGLAVHNLNTDTIRVALSNTAPTATMTIFGDITEIGAGNGYTAGGEDTTNTYTETAGTGSCVGVDVVWTAAGGTIGAFRYVVLYNDTPASPLNPLIGWWDHGTSITLADTETFTADFGATMFTIGP